jgi:hypothetical protein
LKNVHKDRFLRRKKQFLGGFLLIAVPDLNFMLIRISNPNVIYLRILNPQEREGCDFKSEKAFGTAVPDLQSGSQYFMDL